MIQRKVSIIDNSLSAFAHVVGSGVPFVAPGQKMDTLLESLGGLNRV